MASTGEKCFSWLFQTKPLIYPNKKKAVICFLFLCAFSLITQSSRSFLSLFYDFSNFFLLVRWSIPSLQIAGLQCASCGESDSETYESCQAQCLDLTDVQMGALSGPAFT